MKHFADKDGNYLGCFVGRADRPNEIVVPKDAVEVPAPSHGWQRWDGSKWTGTPPAKPKTEREEIEELKARIETLERGK